MLNKHLYVLIRGAGDPRGAGDVVAEIVLSLSDARTLNALSRLHVINATG